MSVIIEKKREVSRTSTMVAKLSTLLRHPETSHGQPMINENSIPQTKSIHVVVIWDDWRNLSPTERSSVILQAYSKATRFSDSNITVAMGLTAEESLRMGFLPYSIVSTRRQTDKVTLARLVKTMADAGGIVVKIGDSTQLRFASLEQAENAYRFLSQEIPGPYWAIIQDQPTAE